MSPRPRSKATSQRCQARSFAFVTECRGEPPYTIRFTGYYEDSVVKVDGEWLFASASFASGMARCWRGFPVAASASRASARRSW